MIELIQFPGKNIPTLLLMENIVMNEPGLGVTE